MREFRARDADRDRCVEVIEAAYVDGQIGDADRELRVSRARSAETREELEGLTRDLRPTARTMTPATSRVSPPARPGRYAGGVVAGLGAVVVLVGAGVTGVVALAMFAVSGTSETVTSPGFEAAPAPVESATRGASYRMTAPQVRRFVTAYEKKFGTLEAFEVVLFPQRVGVQVPVRGPRPRMERWTWDGEWRQDTTAAAVTGPNQRVDAGAIDARLLLSNIRVAERGLDVEGARFTHAVLHRRNDGPTELNIYVGNELQESGYLSTTPAGDVVRRHPYAP